MLVVAEAKDIASQYYSQIFCLLLLKCGCYVNCKPPLIKKPATDLKTHGKEGKTDKDQKARKVSTGTAQISPSRYWY